MRCILSLQLIEVFLSISHHKLKSFFLLSSVVISSVNGFELRGALDQEFGINSLSGPACSTSVQPPSLSITSLRLSGDGTAGTYNYNFDLGVRGGGDRMRYGGTISLSNLRLQIENEKHNLTAGNVFEHFSQFSLDAPVKGISYEYKKIHSNIENMTVVFGFDNPLWEDLFDKKSNSVRRMVAGAEVSTKWIGQTTANLSYVFTNDLTGYNDDSEFLYNTVALDWENQSIAGLDLRGSSAFSSRSTKDSADGSIGFAHYVSAISVDGLNRAELEYGRVSNNFVAPVGSYLQDRQSVKAKLRYGYSRDLSFSAAYLFYHNNLNKQLSVTTYNHKPEIGVSASRFMGRRFATGGSSYRIDSRLSGEVKSIDHILGVNYSDRISVIDFGGNLDYIFARSKRDSADNMQNRIGGNLSVSSRFVFGVMNLRPSLRYAKQYISADSSSGDGRDDISVRADIGWPGIGISTNLVAGYNDQRRGNGSQFSKFYSNLMLNWRPEFLRQSSFYLSAGFNDISQSSKSLSSDDDFSELLISTGFNLEF